MAVIRKEAISDAAPNERAVMGNNQPPPEERIPAEFREAVLSERADFYLKLDDLLGSGNPNAEDYKPGAVDRAKCEDEEALGRCGKLVTTLRAAKQLVEKVHTEQKAPHLLAGRLVDAQKNALFGRILSGMDAVERLQNDYIRERDAKAEAERLAEVERRRKLEELAKEQGLADVLPPPPPPPPAKTEPLRTDGATVGSGKTWKSEVEDYAKAFKHVSKDAKVREAIDAAIQRHVKATKGNNGKPMAGVRMWEDTQVRNR